MNKIIQITSGRGPEECCFVVSKVLKKMIKELKKHNCYHQVISRIPSDINSNLHSATLSVDVTNNKEVLSDWIGTIQWIGNSPFRRNHKRKNWFIGVFELENSAVKELEMKQVKFENTRSGGPGGQHVNKVSSAVRATHIPTGLMVKVSDTRSQIQNKKLAIVRLQELWNNHQINKVKETNEHNWRNHTNLLRGNPVKVFRENDFKKEPKPKKYKHDRSKENQKWKRELN